MGKNSYGFNLIEILVAVAIISILVALARPAYVNYLKRSRLDEAFELVHPFQKRIEEACNMDTSSWDVFGTGNGGYATDNAGNNMGNLPYYGLFEIRWYFPTTGYNQYFLQLGFNLNKYPASDGTDMSYLRLYMLNDGKCNITWVCQNHNNATFQMQSQWVPKFCSATNTYGN